MNRRELLRLLSWSIAAGAGRIEAISAANTLVGKATANNLPAECFQNIRDYGYMWWRNGWRREKIFCIGTSRYQFEFDYSRMTITRLTASHSTVTESKALTKPNLPPALPTEAFTMELSFEADGKRYLVSGGSPPENCQIIETGKWFQRKFMSELQFSGQTAPCEGAFSGLEIAAWPDRISLIFHIQPSRKITTGAIEMNLRLPSNFQPMPHQGQVALFIGQRGNSLCIFGTSEFQTDLDSDGHRTIRTRLEMTSWPKGQSREVALILYPSVHPAHDLAAYAEAAEAANVRVRAVQLGAAGGGLHSHYDSARGWYQIDLRPVTANNNLLERVPLELTNPTNQPQVVRLNIARDGVVAMIPGIAPMLRDADLNPCGIPVQISKDWHFLLEGNGPQRFQGPWFHGLTMLTLPSHRTIKLEFVCAGGMWGHVPQVAHSQLSLVGWGWNQQWDEAAIGSWGESMTFDPDVGLGRSMIDDVRPLMVWAMSKTRSDQKWSWTNNVGGGDFLVYFDALGQKQWNNQPVYQRMDRPSDDESGHKQWNSRMRTQYRRYCPNLTEVIYGGVSEDGKIGLRCRTSLMRTNDYVRVFFHLSYHVYERVDFSRLAFFQLGADHYNDGPQPLRYARGNLHGMVEEWVPPLGGWKYSRQNQPNPGPLAWYWMHCADHLPPANRRAAKRFGSQRFGAWANRGLVVRSFAACFGGRPERMPHYSVYGTNDLLGSSDNGPPSALIEISPPPGLTHLDAGDFVDLDLVEIVVPQKAGDYYGPNLALRQALRHSEHTWDMALREARGNNISVTATDGRVKNTFPVCIRSVDGWRAVFSISGGIGFLPITLTGLRGYRNPVLEINNGQGWKIINQANHGKDFWQTDFDAESGFWEVTYNVPVEESANASHQRDLRFHVSGID
jgi:hypothetical protein